MTDRNRLAKLAVAFFVSVAALSLIPLFGDVREALGVLYAIDYRPLLPIVLLAVCWQVMRALRVGYSLGFTVRDHWRGLVHATALHMFFASIMPVRSGELALPYLLHRWFATPVARSVTTLLGLRLYDLAALLLIAGITILANPFENDVIGSMNALGLTASIAALAYLAIGPQILGWMIHRLRDRASGSSSKRSARLAKLLSQMEFAPPDFLAHLKIGVLSLAIWILIFLSFFLSLLAVTPEARVDIAILSGAASSLSVAQPVNGVAGLGVVQLAWTSVATSLGLALPAALASAVLHHLVQIVASAFNAMLVLILHPPWRPLGMASTNTLKGHQ